MHACLLVFLAEFDQLLVAHNNFKLITDFSVQAIFRKPIDLEQDDERLGKPVI